MTKGPFTSPPETHLRADTLNDGPISDRRVRRGPLLVLLMLVTALTTQAATYTVTNTADSGAGSLRQAILDANASAANDVIVFQSPFFDTARTITLSSGEVTIANNGSLTIDGPGADLLTISGNNVFRVIEIGDFATVTLKGMTVTNGGGGFTGQGGGILNNLGTLTINDSVITGNYAPFTGGGGIYNNQGTVTLNRSTVHNNTATGGGGGLYNSSGTMVLNDTTVRDHSTGQGGGIYNTSGNLTLNRSTLRNNSASIGGAIYNENQTAEINDSTINGNTANNTGGGIYSIGSLILNDSAVTNNTAAGGGGIYALAGGLTISGSTISNNTVTGQGGGIYAETTTTLNGSAVGGNTANGNGGGISFTSNTLNVNDSTISANSTSGNLGGGIYVNNGTLNLKNSTVSGNSADMEGGGIHNASSLFSETNLSNSTVTGNSAVTGGGMRMSGNSKTINNTIVANNLQGGDCSFLGGSPIISHSLIKDGSCGVSDGVNGNRSGVDPMLGPLQNNGGPTKTHALLPGSPVIDIGSNALIPAGFINDQRGSNRIFNTTVDMGAYEAFYVNSTADPGDGTCDAADCTLREAIALANSTPSGEVISFDLPSVPFSPASSTITLASGELNIAANGKLSIIGPGRDMLTINGNNVTRVFHISTGADAEVRGATITGGNGIGASSPGPGGGIYIDRAVLALIDTSVKNNSAPNSGGGIYNLDGTLTLEDSSVSDNTGPTGGGIDNNIGTIVMTGTTFSGNTASTGDGGGIYNQFGPMTVTNSTFSGNAAASGDGGAIRQIGGTLTMTSATLSNNSARFQGGGGLHSSGAVTLLNTIIANSPAGGDCYRMTGTFNASYSLIGDGLGCVNGTNANNLTGDPMLGPLADNGGPTLTHALMPGSPAIDAADPSNFPATDQRGFARPADGGAPLRYSLNKKTTTGVMLALRPDIGAFELLAPTSARAVVSGRVLTANGRPVPRAVVHLTEQNGNIRSVRTNPFGRYRFSGIEVGQVVTLSASAKGYRFRPQVFSFEDTVTGLDIIAESPSKRGFRKLFQRE